MADSEPIPDRQPDSTLNPTPPPTDPVPDRTAFPTVRVVQKLKRPAIWATGVVVTSILGILVSLIFEEIGTSFSEQNPFGEVVIPSGEC